MPEPLSNAWLTLLFFLALAMALTLKQKQVYDFISAYWQKHTLAPTQREIKEHFHLKSFGSVQRYINYLKAEGLLSNDWNVRRGLKPLPRLAAQEGEIPLLGLIAAGRPIEPLENPQNVRIPSDLALHALDHGEQLFALRVRGDSMIEDGILPNDLIICKAAQNARKGEKVVAVVDGEATLKHYIPHKNSIELRPANQSMASIEVSPEQHFEIRGIMIGLWRQF